MIADRPLQEIVPLQLAEDRSAPAANGNGNGSGKAERQYKIVTQYSMGPIEEIGLLKMDFLGLRNLDVIEDAVEIIHRSRGVELDMGAIPMDDAKTFEMLSRGDGTGVFQLESEGMREAMKKVRPTEFDDIVALVSLYRPGAMRYIPDYAKGKRDPASVTYPDERLRPITEPTYGCVLYQEQLMEIAKRMAGFSPAEADDLRKAIGKKKRDLMATMKAKFMEGMEASGTATKVASDMWSLMEAAADYSFNKSHAACYALISYRTAYLKANYPAEYMAAVISSVMNTKDKVPFFVNRCEEMGIEVLPPDVNSSDHDFVVSEKAIRFGLDAVKNVGHAAVEAILRAREDGADRLDLGLLRAGRLARGQQTGDRVPDQVRRARLDRGDPQGDAGGAAGGAVGGAEGPGGRPARPGLDLRLRRGRGRRRGRGVRRPAPAADLRRRVRPRRAAGDGEGDARAPTSPRIRSPKCATRCAPGSTARWPSWRGKPDGAWVTVGGIVTACKKIRTKSGTQMMFATLDDVEGQVEMLVFKADQAESATVIAPDAVVLVRGRLDHKDRGETKLVVQEAERFEPDRGGDRPGRAAAASAPAEPLRLTIDAAAFETRPGRGAEGRLRAPQGRGRRAPGDPHGEGEPKELKLGDGYRVRPSSGLRAELDHLLGDLTALAA